MSHRKGQSRCPACRSWAPDHTCPSTPAVMASAFGGPGRVEGSNDVHCDDQGCEHKRWSVLLPVRQVARAAA